MRDIIENIILPDYFLCFVLRVLDFFGTKLKKFGFCFENFGKLRVIISKLRGKL